jgi:hypothetical protein
MCLVPLAHGLTCLLVPLDFIHTLFLYMDPLEEEVMEHNMSTVLYLRY